ncbi:hypothetical protein AALF16_25940 [Bacillus cereus]|uniref:hypothetical protein n=1 Tax=Bacillus cereus TaxID=1396 RepID=UPI00356BFE3D
MKKGFQITTNVPGKDETEIRIKSYYNSWRTMNSYMNLPFVALYKTFRDEHLATLEAGPLRLYLYFSFYANNQHGHSWHSVETIADFFDTQTRTIDNWIKVLVDKKLIYREKKGKKSHTTYLIPYNNSIISHTLKNKYSDLQKNIDNLISKIEEHKFLYGEIIKVYQLFQWRSKETKANKIDSLQFILIITERDGIITGHICNINKKINLIVDTLEIDEVAIFTSPLKYKDKNMTGIALKQSIQILLQKNVNHLIELCEQLAVVNDDDLNQHPTIEYGLEKEITMEEKKKEE